MEVINMSPTFLTFLTESVRKYYDNPENRKKFEDKYYKQTGERFRWEFRKNTEE